MSIHATESITPAGMWSVFIVGLRSLDSRNVGGFLRFKCHSYLELLAQALQAVDNVLTPETLVGAFLPLKVLWVGSLSLLAPLKAQQVPWHQQCQDKAGCCTPQVQDALPPYKHMRRLWRKFPANLSVSS